MFTSSVSRSAPRNVSGSRIAPLAALVAGALCLTLAGCGGAETTGDGATETGGGAERDEGTEAKARPRQPKGDEGTARMEINTGPIAGAVGDGTDGDSDGEGHQTERDEDTGVEHPDFDLDSLDPERRAWADARIQEEIDAYDAIAVAEGREPGTMSAAERQQLEAKWGARAAAVPLEDPAPADAPIELFAVSQADWSDVEKAAWADVNAALEAPSVDEATTLAARAIEQTENPDIRAAASFVAAERERHQWMASDIPQSAAPAELQRAFEADARKAETLRDDYVDIVDMKAEPTAAIAAATRTGDVFRTLIERMEAMPVPEAISADPEKEAAYRGALEDSMAPIESAAIEAYEAALGYADEADITGPYAGHAAWVLAHAYDVWPD